MDWYLKVLKNYVGFRGRARRKEYWMFILVNIIYTIIDSITDANNELIKSINTMAYKNLMYAKACLESWIFFLILLAVIGIVFLLANLLMNRKPKSYNK